MISTFALAMFLAPAPSARAIDPTTPTAVPAPEGEDVPIDGAAIVAEPELGPIAPAIAPPKPQPPRPTEPAPQKKKWPESNRRGVLLSAGIGAGGCTQDQCEPLKAVPWFGLTGGYRFGRFAPIVTLQGGAGPAKGPVAVALGDDVIILSSARDTRRFLNIGAGTLLHLLVTTPFDPYFGLTIGYLQTAARFRGEGVSMTNPGVAVDVEAKETVHRGTLGIIIGMNFRIRRRVTLGPRVDVLVPFAGKSCFEQADGSNKCFKLADIEGVDPGQYFPRPWAATLQVGFVI